MKLLIKEYITNILRKRITTQSKNLETDDKKEIVNSMYMTKRAKRKANVLLIDDLYQTGVTLTAAVKVLRTDPNINNIHVLTLTKTKG